jgi:hypothetical protein
MQSSPQDDFAFVEQQLALAHARHRVQLVVPKFSSLALEVLRYADLVHSDPLFERTVRRRSPEKRTFFARVEKTGLEPARVTTSGCSDCHFPAPY